MKVENQHYSGINFDWVVVRDLRFADNPATYAFRALVGPTADIQVQSSLDEERRTCRVLVRVQLAPPGDAPDQFQAMAATIEGQFSIAPGATPTVDLEAFGKKQAAAILMPFVREALAGATAKSRFGQVLLPPINMIALMEQVEAAKAKAQGELPAAAQVRPGA